jgi:hypothetical protein
MQTSRAQPTTTSVINQTPYRAPSTSFVQSGPSPADIAAQQQAAAEAARMQGVRDEVGRGVKNKYGAYGMKYDNFGNEYDRTLRDFGTEYIGKQNTLNNSFTNNALNLRRGMATIAGGIRDAIRSGGVTLASMNASNSGASEAFARAFAKQGNQQFNEVNNQAALERNTLNTDQGNLNQWRGDKLTDYDVWGDSTVKGYDMELGQELDYADAQAIAQGAQNAVDYSQRGQLYNQSRQRIDQIDAALQARLANVRAMTPEEVDAQAAAWDVQGMEGYNPFRVNFDGTVGQPGNGNGANPGQLPIFTLPRRNDEYYA